MAERLKFTGKSVTCSWAYQRGQLCRGWGQLLLPRRQVIPGHLGTTPALPPRLLTYLPHRHSPRFRPIGLLGFYYSGFGACRRPLGSTGVIVNAHHIHKRGRGQSKEEADGDAQTGMDGGRCARVCTHAHAPAPHSILYLSLSYDPYLFQPSDHMTISPGSQTRPLPSLGVLPKSPHLHKPSRG